MVGAAGLTSVKLWVQTTKEATVTFTYYEAAQQGKKWHSQPVTTTSETAFTVTVKLDSLQPAKKYAYELNINNKKVPVGHELSFKTLPGATHLPAITITAGSCFFAPQDSANLSLRIFPAILRQKPDLMLWLGDNIYLGESDWSSREGYYFRNTYNRSNKRLQPLLGSVHHYAIWDDHDFGENNANRNWPYKEFSAEAFRDFWPNPAYPTKGIYSTFTWADAQFFLLDCRWFRSSNKAKATEREMFGEEQINWLMRELQNSTATFKFLCIGSQTLSSSISRENYKRYNKERSLLLSSIKQANISGVIFLDGDRHFSELSKVNRDNTYPLYGLTVSPLTSRTARRKINLNRVAGTLFTQNNFAVLQITGEKGSRSLQLRIHDADGNKIWQKTINEHELRK